LVVSIVLAAGKVPQEVAEIHVAELIVEEVFEVLAIGRTEHTFCGEGQSARAAEVIIFIEVQLGDASTCVGIYGIYIIHIVDDNGGVFEAGHPVLITSAVRGYAATVDTWEEHVQLRIHLGLILMALNHVIVFAGECHSFVVGYLLAGDAIACG
jgi:hypothetical protein